MYDGGPGILAVFGEKGPEYPWHRSKVCHKPPRHHDSLTGLTNSKDQIITQYPVFTIIKRRQGRWLLQSATYGDQHQKQTEKLYHFMKYCRRKIISYLSVIKTGL